MMERTRGLRDLIDFRIFINNYMRRCARERRKAERKRRRSAGRGRAEQQASVRSVHEMLGIAKYEAVTMEATTDSARGVTA